MCPSVSVRHALSSGAAGLLSLFTLAGCQVHGRARYVEPRADQPHALVAIVRKHTSQPGPFREDIVHVNGQDVSLGTQNLAAMRVAADAYHWFASTRYWHTETRTSLETKYYTEYETDYCAYRNSRGDCQSGRRAVTKSRLENVTRLIEVTDAACDASSSYQLENGNSYRLTFTFEGAGACSLGCREVTDGAEERECQRWTPPVASTPSTAAPSAVSSPVSLGTKTSRPLHTLGVVAVAVGGIGLGTGLAAGLYATERKLALARHCDEARTCDEAGLAAARDGGTAVSIANVASLAGVSFALAGLGLIAFGPTKTLSVSPTNGGARIGVGGTF
ncbi:MAG: hypothetical protein KF795_02625 [Labilithrix sp.]|nr:hypothetical protein [Labilithrix sp.]